MRPPGASAMYLEAFGGHSLIGERHFASGRGMWHGQCVHKMHISLACNMQICHHGEPMNTIPQNPSTLKLTGQVNFNDPGKNAERPAKDSGVYQPVSEDDLQIASHGRTARMASALTEESQGQASMVANNADIEGVVNSAISQMTNNPMLGVLKPTSQSAQSILELLR